MRWGRLRLILIFLSALGLLFSLYAWRQLSPRSASEEARRARDLARERALRREEVPSEKMRRDAWAEAASSVFPKVEDASGIESSSPEDNRYLLDLKEEMPELVGWLSFPDCDIDEPVVQARDNLFYLDHDASQKPHWLGACFLDFQVEAKLMEIRSRAELCREITHLPLYGHYYQGGEMLSGLHRFAEQSFRQELHHFSFDLPAFRLDFEVVGAFYLQPDQDGLDYNNILQMEDGAAREAFVSGIKRRAFFWRDFEPSEEDLYMTLTTCSSARGDARLVILAVNRAE